MSEEYCDPVTGACSPADLKASESQQIPMNKNEIIYLGDPMCSWCWGISNHLKALKTHFSDYKFTIVLGGLRPGGGDQWNDEMKGFLRHHWEEVTQRSGQPFGFKLFEQDHFNYDTEPPCRAVVAGRKWVSDDFSLFEAISRKFYVDNEDPSIPEFYRSICTDFDIPFDEFVSAFDSDETRKKTSSEFYISRQLGVTVFPSVLIRSSNQIRKVTFGYADFDQMRKTIDQIVLETTLTSS